MLHEPNPWALLSLAIARPRGAAVRLVPQRRRPAARCSTRSSTRRWRGSSTAARAGSSCRRRRWREHARGARAVPRSRARDSVRHRVSRWACDAGRRARAAAIRASGEPFAGLFAGRMVPLQGRGRAAARARRARRRARGDRRRRALEARRVESARARARARRTASRFAGEVPARGAAALYARVRRASSCRR